MITCNLPKKKLIEFLFLNIPIMINYYSNSDRNNVVKLNFYSVQTN